MIKVLRTPTARRGPQDSIGKSAMNIGNSSGTVKPIPPRPAKPAPVVIKNIPRVLKDSQQCVVWGYTLRDNSYWTKKPFYLRHGKFKAADSTDPQTWMTFDDAYAAYRRNSWDGLGRIHLPTDS